MTTTTDAPPRKIVIGSLMHPFWGDYPGIESRLRELSGWIDKMGAQAAEEYPGAGLDLAVLPEVAVTGPAIGEAHKRAAPLEGPVLEITVANYRTNFAPVRHVWTEQ